MRRETSPAPGLAPALPPWVAPGLAPHRWLLFVHQLPATPTGLRVRTWRRLQQIGTVPLKQAVYALPNTTAAREDLEWLAAEVRQAGGDAVVLAASMLDAAADDALIDTFRRARQDAYHALAHEIDAALKAASAKRRARHSPRGVAALRERLAAIERIDFFGSAGRDRVVSLLSALERRQPATRPEPAVRVPTSRDARDYAGRVWITRPRPGVDRMSSAWLIRRCIDAQARFAFADEGTTLPGDAVSFDRFGGEFTHRGEACTFETLCADFGIDEPAIVRIAALVHDLDLKDGRFGVADATTVGTVIDGLQLATSDDHELLERGMTLFESLYQSYRASTTLAGPRAVSTPGSKRAASRRRRSTRRT